jgi:hypothetical protein
MISPRPGASFIKALCLTLSLAALPLPGQAAAGDDVAAAREAALAVMDAFLEAFNARDESAWADTLHYPHVRIASGTVAVYPDREAFLENRDLNAFAEQTGWDYSTWDDLSVVHASPDKVHIAVRFTRYDRQGAEMASYDSFYVVERIDGRWGVRARSSFAP